MNLSPILLGESRVRLIQGAVVGAAVTMLLGFGWGGWQLQSRADARSDVKVSAALVTALTPICVANFQQASDVTVQKAALKATDSWQKDTFVERGGWATFPGKTEPYRMVAEACAKVLSDVK